LRTTFKRPATLLPQVGPTYGRKMIKGKLEAENIKVHDKRISASLTRVTPGYQQLRRQNTARLLNPVPYKADYFGHKLHFDQNEKLVMYGCTSVIAVDGYSNSILGIATMPVKNNVEIYRCLYRFVHAPIVFITSISLLRMQPFLGSSRYGPQEAQRREKETGRDACGGG